MYAERSSIFRPHVFAIITDYEADRRSVALRNRLQFAGITLGTAALFVTAGLLLGNETDTSVDAETSRSATVQPVTGYSFEQPVLEHDDTVATQQESNAFFLAIPGVMAGAGIAFVRSLTLEDY